MLLALPVMAKQKQDIDTFVSRLMSQMTVDEKIGQLNLTICSEFVSGQINDNTSAVEESLRKGELGGLFGFKDATRIRELQKMAVENSRLHIPLIFGYDVVHGFDVTFPIPLALSTSWNPSLVEEMARISAREAAAKDADYILACVGENSYAETKTVTLKLKGSDLAFVGGDGHWVLEKGDFKLRVGGKETTITASDSKRWETPNIEN